MDHEYPGVEGPLPGLHEVHTRFEPRGAIVTLTERRAAFLAGEGTLTAQEVREWAKELEPARPLPSLPLAMLEDEPLMVSVVLRTTAPWRGLTRP